MRVLFSYPFAVLTMILFAMAGMSAGELLIEQLCQQRVIANGLSKAAATRACERF